MATPREAGSETSASHLGLRRVVTRFFNVARVAAAVPVIQRAAEDLLDAVRSQIDATGRCELFSSFAQVLPCRVLMELLGIQGVTPATLIRWSDASLELFWGKPRRWPCA
ncbi:MULTISPECIES: cytochrome P450 [Streptomyces]|uniref:cytochrome P450 n=1 Tax=Streptomyces lycopersici TaxID=2974589 RepID=UPI0021CEEBC1|nr:cytochrome P450 [Streptomyces sp. NEAU-383]